MCLNQTAKIMFGFFKSKKQKGAKDLLGTAYKVYNYRCDIIDQADAKKLAESKA